MTKHTKPFSIRLSISERADLERRAKGQALGEFVSGLLFGEAHGRKPSGKKTRRPRTPSADLKPIAQVLGMLGQSDLSRSMRDMAEAARLGVLRVTPETEATIQKACQDIKAVRAALVAALGVRERYPSLPIQVFYHF